MLKRMIPFQIGMIGFIILFSVPSAVPQSKYPETIATLQTAYRNEIQAHLNYLAYARKANSENYPNVAYLFCGFAASEWIHARDFRQILSELEGQVKETPKPDVKVFNTKANLKNALDFELKDIDQRYPQLIEKIKPEKHEAAIRDITYAWESEKQHRDLIQKMQSGTGIFFGLLAKKIEETSVRYFVCQICGSTVVELPKDSCPICKMLISNFKEVGRIK